MRRQTGLAAWTVRHDLEILVEQPAIKELLEVPPHRLHVGGVVRVIRVLGVDPVPDACGQAFELLDMSEHRFTTEPRELRDAHALFNLFFTGDAELLFHLHLDGEPVRVPAGATRHEATLHRLIATEEVLVNPGPDVMKARQTVRGRRTLIKHPRVATLSQRDGPLEDVVRLPTCEFGLLDGHKLEFGADRAKHGSPSMNSHIVVNEMNAAVRPLLCEPCPKSSSTMNSLRPTGH